jgi:hypothetical protein
MQSIGDLPHLRLRSLVHKRTSRSCRYQSTAAPPYIEQTYRRDLIDISGLEPLLVPVFVIGTFRILVARANRS